MAEQGWLSIIVPEAAGGLGLGLAPAAAVARILGRSAQIEPFGAVGVFAAALLVETGHPCCSDDLAALIAGERLIGVGWQAEGGAIDPRACRVSADGDEGALRLNGVTRYAVPAAADAFLIAATRDGELGLYIVACDAPGVTISAELAADGTALARIALQDATPRNEIARGAGAEQALARALDMALVVTASELLGLMDGALEMTLDYLRTRKQFGVAIGSFQALQHRAVDLWMQREITEAAVSAAITLMDSDTNRATQGGAASGAKARAAQAALQVCGQCVQLHGAIGFADEYGLGLYLNRALSLAAWLGNAAQHRARFASLSPLDVRDASQVVAA
jgi:alkylation response protein AidB-like acyl-CoA dehydrogenase